MSVNTVKQDGSLQRIAGGTLYADAPIGTISPFGGSSVPSGYLLCNGQAVNRTTYAELFAVIGTAFGTGDGSTTFNVPDMRESVPKGAGLTGKTVGAHLDADGLAVGEFLDDRIQNITGEIARSGAIGAGGAFYGDGGNYNANLLSGSVDGSKHNTYFDASRIVRAGNTTEVKAVGVNYIIKAKQVAAPADFMDAIDDAISAIKDGTNIDSFGDVETALAGKANSSDLGDKSNLTTTDKSSVVAAINEVNTVTTTSITALSLLGLTLSWLDNSDNSHRAIRVGNMVIVNVGLDIDGTFTGTTDWIPVYDLPSSLLRSGESFITPYFTSMMCTNRRNGTVYTELIEGRRVWLDSTVDEYHLRISGQMILPIVKS